MAMPDSHISYVFPVYFLRHVLFKFIYNNNNNNDNNNNNNNNNNNLILID